MKPGELYKIVDSGFFDQIRKIDEHFSFENYLSNADIKNGDHIVYLKTLKRYHLSNFKLSYSSLHTTCYIFLHKIGFVAIDEYDLVDGHVITARLQ